MMPDFQNLPEILKQNNQKMTLQVENAFNILNLLMDQTNTVSTSFEVAVVDLCTRILYVNFDLSTSIFSVLNNFY